MQNRNNQKLNAYTFIKEKILNCEILPGAYINEKELIAQSNFGRTPIREALILLGSENFVEVRSRQGTYAKQITKKDIENLFNLRKLLEPAIAMQYKHNLSTQKLLDFDEQMKEFCQNSQQHKNKQLLYTLDIDFHRYIIASSNNQRIIDTLEPLLQETYRIGIFNSLVNTENTPEKTYEQHKQIITALLCENDTAIHDAFLFHLNHSLSASLMAITE